MIVACPACHAEMTLDVLLPHEEARQLVGQLLERGIGLGGVAARYVALFRTGKRRMSIERMCSLVSELVPDIERQAITRKGREWPAPTAVWREAMEVVLAKRDKGTLTLPLTGHGLLHEVICGLVDKAEATAERDREDGRRQHREAGVHDGGFASPVDMLVGEKPSEQTAPAPAPVRAAPTGPSAYARKVKAEIEARKSAREVRDPDTFGGAER